jgi:hypothetical protein
MRDITNNLTLKRALAPVVAGTDNTAYVSQILDTRDYDAVMLAIQIGTNTDVDVTFTVLLEESNDSGMSGQNAVADVDMNGTELLAGFQFDDDNECRKLGYIGSKRYIRATITPANNGAGNIYIAGLWVCKPLRAPAENPPA